MAYIPPARDDGQEPTTGECWYAGLAVGRAEGFERALDALREELEASGIRGPSADATLEAVARRALAA